VPRALGVDLGERRIGIAVCDSAGVVATPYEVVTRTGDRGRDHARIAAIVEETQTEVVVVGLPLSLNGTRGPAAARVEAELEELRDRLDARIVAWDERLTTVEADKRLQARGMSGRERRRVVDEVAATVILQSWLDAGEPSG
jgi:putative holliday junction resolvase